MKLTSTLLIFIISSLGLVACGGGGGESGGSGADKIFLDGRPSDDVMGELTQQQSQSACQTTQDCYISTLDEVNGKPGSQLNGKDYLFYAESCITGDSCIGQHRINMQVFTKITCHQGNGKFFDVLSESKVGTFKQYSCIPISNSPK